MAVEHIVRIDQRTDLKKTVQEWLSTCLPSLDAEYIDSEDASSSILVNTDVFQITGFASYLQKRKGQLFGVKASISLGFRLLPSEYSRKSALPLLKQACIHWLKTTDTNLILLGFGEKGIIARTNAKVILNSQWWAKEELDNLDFEFDEEVFDL
jgi:hypothetical protein